MSRRSSGLMTLNCSSSVAVLQRPRPRWSGASHPLHRLHRHRLHRRHRRHDLVKRRIWHHSRRAGLGAGFVAGLPVGGNGKNGQFKGRSEWARFRALACGRRATGPVAATGCRTRPSDRWHGPWPVPCRCDPARRKNFPRQSPSPVRTAGWCCRRRSRYAGWY